MGLMFTIGGINLVFFMGAFLALLMSTLLFLFLK